MDATEKKILDCAITDRILGRIDLTWLEKIVKAEGGKSFVIAGNSLNRATPHDIDIYQDCTGGMEEKRLFDFTNPTIDQLMQGIDGIEAEVVCRTDNATTVKHNGVIYQFCKYMKPFEELVKGFDYAHVQVGIKITCDLPTRTTVFYTPQYVTYLLTGHSKYVGSGYPLSSMIRAEKYRRYELLSNYDFRLSVLLALGEVIKRGFYDYADFKDQLKALDLSDLEGEETSAAKMLYQICCERGLVDKP